MDHWREFILGELSTELLVDLTDEMCRPAGRIHPIFVRIPIDFSARISSYVRNGQLKLVVEA